MSLAAKLNKGRQTVAEDIKTEDLEYVKAADIAFEGGDPIRLKGFFTKSGEYGESITLVTDKGLGINIPSRYVEMFKNYTDEEVEEIKAGKLGISAIKADVKTKKGKTTMIEFCDLD